MCNSEQDELDRLYGRALRFADQSGCFFTCIDLLSSAISLEDHQRVAQEMENRAEHQKAWQKEIRSLVSRYQDALGREIQGE